MRVERKTLMAHAEEFLKESENNQFIRRHPEGNDLLVDILFRLAELYYQDAGWEFVKAFDRWNALPDSLRGAAAGTTTQAAPLPSPDYSRAEKLYVRILEEFPQNRHAEDCLYDLAKIYEAEPDTISRAKAIDYYEQIVKKFPNSHYLPMVYMGIGDYWFFKEIPSSPDSSNYRRGLINQTPSTGTGLLDYMNQAIASYQAVLATKDSLMYNDAWFKIGWALYRETSLDSAHFPEAVAAFTNCIETTIRLKARLDPSEVSSFSNNSIRYLALLFTSKQWGDGGLDNAAKFVQENPERHDTYGEAVIHQMGEIHAKLYEWDAAVAAYNLYLMFYPLKREAVVVHEQKIEAMKL
jgi:tetratricopeptide (TPR) repeat protein